MIHAQPERLYDIVAGFAHMPELSPEIVRCEWPDGATVAVPGARFKSTNKVRVTWSNEPAITAAWSRTECGEGTVVWRYRFEPEGEETRGDRELRGYQAAEPVRLVHHRARRRTPGLALRPALRYEADAPAPSGNGRGA